MTATEAPEWDLVDRLKKGLRQADLNVNEMADYLGVYRTTVSSWLTGRTTPKKGILRLWALRCGVPYEWLKGPDEQVCAARDSNPEPAD